MMFWLVAVTLPTVLGVTLGEPLMLPNCPEGAQKTALCVAPQDPPARGVWWLWAHSPDVPSYIHGDGFATVANGVVTKLDLVTDGVHSQESAYAGLVVKFGKPTRVSRTPVQNAFGAKFTDLEATWVRPGFRVLLKEDDLDSGAIEVMTDEEAAASRAAEKRPGL